MTCGWHADDMWMSSAWCADDMRMSYVIHQWQQLCIKPTGFLVFNFLQSFHTTLDFFATKKRIPGSKYCKSKEEKIFQMCDEKQQTHTSMALGFLERLHLCLSFSWLANKAKNLNKLWQKDVSFFFSNKQAQVFCLHQPSDKNGDFFQMVTSECTRWDKNLMFLRLNYITYCLTSFSKQRYAKYLFSSTEFLGIPRCLHINIPVNAFATFYSSCISFQKSNNTFS